MKFSQQHHLTSPRHDRDTSTKYQVPETAQVLTLLQRHERTRQIREVCGARGVAEVSPALCTFSLAQSLTLEHVFPGFPTRRILRCHMQLHSQYKEKITQSATLSECENLNDTSGPLQPCFSTPEPLYGTAGNCTVTIV